MSSPLLYTSTLFSFYSYGPQLQWNVHMLRFTQSMHTYTAIMFLNVKLAVVAVSVDMQYCVGCATVIVFVYNTLTNSMGLRV